MKLPLYAGSGEGSDHLGSMFAAFPCKFLQEAVSTTWTRDLSQGGSFYHCAKAPLQVLAFKWWNKLFIYFELDGIRLPAFIEIKVKVRLEPRWRCAIL
jgi:hypothetical protein